MDRISGLGCQIDYFTEHGFHLAAKKTAGILLDWIFFSLKASLSAEDKAILKRELARCQKSYGRQFWADARTKYHIRVALHGKCLGLFTLVRKFERLMEKCRTVLTKKQV